MGYNDSDLEVAYRVVAFLAERARRGQPTTDLALLLFAAGLPVRHEAVVAALRARAGGIRSVVETFMKVAASTHEPIPADMAVSPAFDKAEAAAEWALSTKTALVAMIRLNLRKSKQPAGDPEVLSVLIGLFRTLLGEPPPADDTFMLEQLLYAFGAHGLVEPVSAGGPVVLRDGPSGLAEGLALGGAGVFTLPDDITCSELESARQFCFTLGAALAAIPHAELRHHLGGEEAVGFWQPEDPAKVAQLLIFYVNVSRIGPLDPTPIIAAVQQQGWLPTPKAL